MKRDFAYILYFIHAIQIISTIGTTYTHIVGTQYYVFFVASNMAVYNDNE